MAIIAKENLDIDNLNGPEVPENQIPILEQPTGSDLDTESASRHARNKNAKKSYKEKRNIWKKKENWRVEKSRSKQEVKINPISSPQQ